MPIVGAPFEKIYKNDSWKEKDSNFFEFTMDLKENYWK